MRVTIMALPVLVSLLLVGCHSVRPESGSIEVATDGIHAGLHFTDEERTTIHEYYRGSKGLPPGLAKRKRLPRGLRRQVERRGTLPPGLQTAPLPWELERQLRELPDDYVRVRIGGDIVLMDRKTRVVIDTVLGIGD